MRLGDLALVCGSRVNDGSKPRGAGIAEYVALFRHHEWPRMGPGRRSGLCSGLTVSYGYRVDSAESIQNNLLPRGPNLECPAMG